MTKQIKPKEDSVKKLKSMLEKIEITDNIPGLTDQSKEEQIVKHAFKAVDEYIEKDMQSSPSQEWEERFEQDRLEGLRGNFYLLRPSQINSLLQSQKEEAFREGQKNGKAAYKGQLKREWYMKGYKEAKEEMIKRVEGIFQKSWEDKLESSTKHETPHVFKLGYKQATKTLCDAVLEELRGV